MRLLPVQIGLFGRVRDNVSTRVHIIRFTRPMPWTYPLAPSCCFHFFVRSGAIFFSSSSEGKDTSFVLITKTQRTKSSSAALNDPGQTFIPSHKRRSQFNNQLNEAVPRRASLTTIVVMPFSKESNHRNSLCYYPVRSAITHPRNFLGVAEQVGEMIRSL